MDFSKMVLLVPALAVLSVILLYSLLRQLKIGKELERKYKNLIQTARNSQEEPGL